MKKILALLLVVVMVLGVFTACASNAKTDSTQEGETTTDTKTEQTNNAEAPVENTANSEEAPAGLDTQNKVRLSVVGPTTGSSAEYGIGFQRAAEMMAEKWNNNGGCDGREVEIVVYDDKGSIEEDLSLAQMITEDTTNYATVGHFAGPVAVAPIYEEAEMCFVAPAASAVEFSGIGDYSFRNNYTLQLDAKWLTDIAVEMGYSECGVIYVQTDWGAGALKTLKDELATRDDFKIVAEEAVSESQTDFSVIVEKFKNQGINCVMCEAFYPIIAPFSSQIKAEIPEVQLFAPGSVYNDEFLKLAGADASGLICTTAFASENEDPTSKAFSDEYYSRYGSYPSGQTAQCYDSLGLLLQAIDNLGLKQPDGPALKEELEKITYEGVCGTTTFDELHDAHKPRWVVQVADGGGKWNVWGSVE